MCVYRIFIISSIQRGDQIDEHATVRWCCISYTAIQMWPFILLSPHTATPDRGVLVHNRLRMWTTYPGT